MKQLIMSHVGTDFDGLASMVLAQKLYPGSDLVFPGRKSGGVKEFYDLHKRHFPALANKEALASKPDRLIVVDTRTPSRLGHFRPWFQDPEVELHIYDHHPPTAESVRGDQEWVESVGAAATLLVEQCRKRNLPISYEEATLTLIALHEETGSFRYSSTTARDLEAASYMMSCGANLEVVAEFLQEPLTPGQRLLLEDFLRDGHLVEGQAGRLYVAHAKRPRSVFGLGMLASRIMDIEGTDAVCCVLEVENEGTSVAARASNDIFDMSNWMAYWGGGGHVRAAAASQIQDSAESVMEKLAENVQEGSAQVLTAGDVMSSDLFSISLDSTVDQTYEKLHALGFHSAVVVDEAGHLQGLVCRTDLTRALDHKLGHAPAKSVMTHKVVSVDVNDTLDEVRRVVVERHVGSLPVMKDGELVGIVTRTDLLRELYHQSEHSVWQGIGGARVSLAETPEPFLSWIKTTARLAKAKKIRLYAVGGFVRDLLLGRGNDDLDLVAEGDALALARDVSGELGGKLLTHEKYLTAAIKFEDGNKLDIATARREVYVRPAALPEVAESKLKSDLYRRDFTVNALALRLDDQLHGTVIDFFGGRQDLDGKKIRVLHNHSFLDDPTRILRAVRFEQRLGFTIEPHTVQLIRSALETDIFSLANGDRLAEEFRLSLSEHDPMKVLTRLQKLRVLPALHPELNFQGKLPDRVKRSIEFLKEYPDLVDPSERWIVPLMFFALQLSEEANRELAQRFGWKISPWPFDINLVLSQISRHKLSASDVAELLDRSSPVQLAVLASVSTHPVFEERVTHYLKVTRHMKPLLSGRHILEEGIEPGPEVARWKSKAHAAQRNEEFSDVEGAKAWFSEQLRLRPSTP